MSPCPEDVVEELSEVGFDCGLVCYVILLLLPRVDIFGFFF